MRITKILSIVLSIISLNVCIGQKLDYYQQPNYYQISVDLAHLPLANYESYIYTIALHKKKSNKKITRSFCEENKGKESIKKSSFKIPKQAFEKFMRTLKEELVDSTVVTDESTNEKDVILSDSIFRRASPKRDASLLAQQLDGTHMTLTIYDMNLKSESRAIYTLSSDMTINRIRTGKNEIKWLKLKKILDPILPYIDNETLTYYFSKAQKETLIKVYQERE